jgi:glycosyltransferase involved in cell wall biosynthesis
MLLREYSVSFVGIWHAGCCSDPVTGASRRFSMQILFCNYEYPPIGGGGGVVMGAMAAELAHRGHEITVLTSRAFGLPAEEVQDGVRIVRVPVFFRRQLAVANMPSMAAYLPMGFWRGLRLGRKRAFDVINTHFVVPTGPLGDRLAARLGIPNVLSVHGGDLYDPSKPSSPHRHGWLRSAIAGMLRRADAVVAQSRDTSLNVSRIYGVPRPVELIPLGIARPPVGVRSSRGDYGIPGDAMVLVTVGRLVPRKSTAQLMQVLAKSPEKNIYLLVVGDGPDTPTITQAAEKHGVSDRVRMLGQVTEREKFAALAAADAFVSTSQHEGFGLVFLEAMSMGLPVVCYDRGGQTDFLATPTTGAVVKLNDTEAFTAAVLDLQRSPGRCEEIRRHNLAVVENFFIDRCARRYEAVFERAILARSPSFAAARQK